MDLLIIDNNCAGQAGLKGCYLEVRDWQAHTLLVQEYLTTEKYYFSCWFFLSRIFFDQKLDQNIACLSIQEYLLAEYFIKILSFLRRFRPPENIFLRKGSLQFHVGIFAGKKV